MAKIAVIGTLFAISSSVFAQTFVFYNQNYSADGFLKAKVGCLYDNGYWVETNWIWPGHYDYFRDYVFKYHCPDRSRMIVQVRDVQNNGPYVVCKNVRYFKDTTWSTCLGIRGYGTDVSCVARSCYGFMN
jgi:hypothetical protein